MQKHVNLVDLVKSFPTNIFLQNLASIQKRTSPIKFAHLAEKSEKGSMSNLSTKVSTSPLSSLCRLNHIPPRPRARRRCGRGRGSPLRSSLSQISLLNTFVQNSGGRDPACRRRYHHHALVKGFLFSSLPRPPGGCPSTHICKSSFQRVSNPTRMSLRHSRIFVAFRF